MEWIAGVMTMPDLQFPATESMAILGLILIAAISMFVVTQPESIVVGIASGILGWMKGTSERKQ